MKTLGVTKRHILGEMVGKKSCKESINNSSAELQLL